MSLSSPPPGRNRQWRVLSNPPLDTPIGLEHFELVDEPIPVPGDGQLLLRTLCLGTSPAQRGYVSKTKSMHEKVPIGAVMRGRGVAQVLTSKHPDYAAGEWLMAPTGWQDYCVVNPRDSGILSTRRVDNGAPAAELHLGILGAAGLTAYFGLTDVAQLMPGDCVLISAAAGGVGSCAVQLAQCLDAGKVIGIAGGAEKCAWVRDYLGADAAVDYKSAQLGESLTRLCGKGVDVFFDNVGGEQLDTALEHLNLGARVAICGFIASDYTANPRGPSNYVYLVRRRARMQGFFVFDYETQFSHAEAQLKEWFDAGRLKPCENRVDGLEQVPSILRGLFTGANRGVSVCRVSEPT